MTEWELFKNLDWVVERGAGGDPGRDGGRERLNAKVIVQRKHFYYTTHYILIIFLMTSSVFCAFTFDAAGQIEARTGVIFNLLLTVVAFNYSCGDSVPKTPYPTILDGYINFNFIAILVVGLFVCVFSYLAYDDERTGCVLDKVDGYPTHKFSQGCLYSRDVETACSWSLTALWVFGNLHYWNSVFSRVKDTHSTIRYEEQLDYMDFSKIQKNKKAVWDRQIRDD